MFAKEIVAKIRAMAADPANRVKLVKESDTIRSLLVFLEDKDADIVFNALETVYLLSLHLENRPIMGREDQLLIILRQFMIDGSLKQKKIAIASYSNLQAYASTVPKSSNTSASSVPAASNKSSFQSENFENKYSSSESLTSRVYTIFVSGLNTEEIKTNFSKYALKLKGVISVYCDIIEYKSIIRANIPVQMILDHLMKGGFTSSLRKKDIGIPDVESGYLDEPDDCTKETQRKSSWFGFGSIVTYENDKSDEKDNCQGNNGWFGKIGKALHIM